MKFAPRPVAIAAGVLVVLVICLVWFRGRPAPAPPPPAVLEPRVTRAPDHHEAAPLISATPGVIPLPASQPNAPTPSEIVGIGAVLQVDPGGALRITGTMADSPAAEAGLTDGLIVHSIDHVLTTGMKLSECVARIRGPAGTSVRLEVVDPEGDETNTVTLTRRTIQVRQN